MKRGKLQCSGPSHSFGCTNRPQRQKERELLFELKRALTFNIVIFVTLFWHVFCRRNAEQKQKRGRPKKGPAFFREKCSSFRPKLLLSLTVCNWIYAAAKVRGQNALLLFQQGKMSEGKILPSLGRQQFVESAAKTKRTPSNDFVIVLIVVVVQNCYVIN